MMFVHLVMYNISSLIFQAQPKQPELLDKVETTAEKKPRESISQKNVLVQAEAREVGSVSWQTYKAYAQAGNIYHSYIKCNITTYIGGGIWVYACLLILFITAQLIKGLNDIFLAVWIRAGDGHHYNNSVIGPLNNNPNFSTYALVYGLSGFAFLLFQVIRGYFFNRITIKSSTQLHQAVFNRVRFNFVPSKCN